MAPPISRGNPRKQERPSLLPGGIPESWNLHSETFIRSFWNSHKKNVVFNLKFRFALHVSHSVAKNFLSHKYVLTYKLRRSFKKHFYTYSSTYLFGNRNAIQYQHSFCAIRIAVINQRISKNEKHKINQSQKSKKN